MPEEAVEVAEFDLVDGADGRIDAGDVEHVKTSVRSAMDFDIAR